jgi:hypothetical protein
MSRGNSDKKRKTADKAPDFTADDILPKKASDKSVVWEHCRRLKHDGWAVCVVQTNAASHKMVRIYHFLIRYIRPVVHDCPLLLR